MAEAIRVGVIGAGAIAVRAHIPGLSPEGSPEAALAVGSYQYGGCADSRVIAVADIDGEKAADVAARFRIPNVYENWRELIANPEIDAVTVATPNYLHAEMAIEAAKAGKHVLVEKPMALTVADADAMLAAAKAAGVVLMVEQTERFSPSHEVARDMLAKGCLGKIGSIRTRSSHSGPEYWSPGSAWFFDEKQAGFGAMADLGIHKLDLIRWLVGDEVVDVAAFANTQFKQEKGCQVEDHAVAVLRFSKGTLGILEAVWGTEPPEGRTFIYGSEGNMTLDGPDPLVVEFPARQALNFNLDLPRGKRSNCTLYPNIPAMGVLGGPFRHFVDCIRTGGVCRSGGIEGRNSLAVVLAALESARTRRFVTPE